MALIGRRPGNPNYENGEKSLVYTIILGAIEDWLNPHASPQAKSEARHFIESPGFCDYWDLIFESDPEPVREKLLSGTVDYSNFKRIMMTKPPKDEEE